MRRRSVGEVVSGPRDTGAVIEFSGLSPSVSIAIGSSLRVFSPRRRSLLILAVLALLCTPTFAAATWVRIAAEHDAFTITGTRAVRYGAGSSWVERTMTGRGTCDNVFFGRDPAVDVLKECQALMGAAVAPYPSDVFAGADGSPALLFETDRVEGFIGVVPHESGGWRPRIYAWCVKGPACALKATAEQVRSMGLTAQAVPVVVALSALVTSKPAPGSDGDIAYRTFRSRACRYLTAQPYPVQSPGGFAAGYECPAEPTSLPAVQWATPAADTFTIYTFAAGKVNGVSKAKAPPNAACIDPCPMFKSGTRNLCRLAGGLPNEVTTCLPKPNP